MVEFDKFISACKSTSLTVDRLCKIKKYLTVKEKIEFAEEYTELVNKHINDYPKYQEFIAFIFFNLMVIKKYTDIKLDLTYEEFDALQENGLIDKIVENIVIDYSLLLKFIKMGEKQD